MPSKQTGLDVVVETHDDRHVSLILAALENACLPARIWASGL
jgi:hypothetical protein